MAKKVYYDTEGNPLPPGVKPQKSATAAPKGGLNADPSGNPMYAPKNAKGGGSFLDTALDIGTFGAHSLIKKKTGIGLGNDPNAPGGGAAPEFSSSVAKKRAAELAKQRNMAMAEGQQRGEELFGKKGSFGSVSAKTSLPQKDIFRQREALAASAGQQSQNITDVLAQRKANLAGFTPEEQNAYREQNIGSFNRQQAGALRQLRASQGTSGVRGGMAAAQQAQLLSQGQAAQAGSERDLFLAQQAQKREALGQFETSARGAESENLARKTEALGGLENTVGTQRADILARNQYNQDSEQRRKMAQLSTEFGYGQLGAAEQAQAGQEQLGQLQAQYGAMANQPKRKMFGIF